MFGLHNIEWATYGGFLSPPSCAHTIMHRYVPCAGILHGSTSPLRHSSGPHVRLPRRLAPPSQIGSWLIHTGVRPSGLRSNTGPDGPGRLVSPSGTDMKLVNGPGSGVNARRPAPSARPASDTGRSFVQAREGHFYRGSYKRSYSYKRLDSGFAPSPLSLRLNDGR